MKKVFDSFNWKKVKSCSMVTKRTCVGHDWTGILGTGRRVCVRYKYYKKQEWE